MVRNVLLVLVLIGVTASAAHAQQITLSLNVSSRPSVYVADWASQRETASLIVTNTTSSAIQAVIHVTITRDGVAAASTQSPNMPVETFAPGITVVTSTQLLPRSAIEFYGDIAETVRRTGMLPAGVYELCAELLNPTSWQVLATAGSACRGFVLTSYQLPVLISPDNGGVVRTQATTMFRWTPLSPAAMFAVRYQLKIFELFEGQSPASVIRQGAFLYMREFTNVTQSIWPPDLILPDEARTYVWSILTVDDRGNSMGDPDGWSEPFTFSTVRRSDDKDGGGGVSGGTGGRAGNEGDADSARTGGTGGANDRGSTLGTGTVVSLSGIVRDSVSELPIVGATVVYHPARALPVPAILPAPPPRFGDLDDSLTTLTDSDGRFSFVQARDSSYFSLRTEAAGYVTTYQRGAEMMQRGSITDHLILLRPITATSGAGSIVMHGRVLDASSKTPIAGAHLDATTRLDTLAASTDGEGGFAFQFVRDTSGIQLNVAASGYHGDQLRWAWPFDAQQLADVVISLEPKAGVVNGRICDSITRTGIDGITVQLWKKGAVMTQSTSLSTGATKTVGKGIIGKKVTPSLPSKPGASAGGGLHPLRDVLIATTTTFSSAGSLLGSTPPGFRTIGSGIPATGTARGAGGIPSAGGHAGTLTPGGIAQISNAGYFIFDDVDVGNGYYVVVKEEGYHEYTGDRFDKTSTEKVNLGCMYIQPIVGSLTVKVTNADGVPLADADVYLLPGSGVNIQPVQRQAGAAPVSSGTSGAKLNPMPGGGATSAGGAKIGGTTSGGTTSGGTGKTGASQGSRLSQPSQITKGAKLANAEHTPPPVMPDTIVLYGPKKTDAQGTVTFEAVKVNARLPGWDRYDVWVRHDLYNDGSTGARLLTEGQHIDASVVLDLKKGTIVGTVRDIENLEPLAGARVALIARPIGGKPRLAPVNPLDPRYSSLSATSDAQGNFTIADIPFGTYEAVQISRAGYATSRITDDGNAITFAAGSDCYDVQAQLERASAIVRGTVTDHADHALAGAALQGTTSPTLSTATDYVGNFELQQVPPGAQAFVCSYPGCNDTTVIINVPAGKDTVIVAIRMQPLTASVEIVVVDSVTQMPVSSAVVTLGIEKRTDAAGMVSFSGPIAGQQMLDVQSPSMETAGDYLRRQSGLMLVAGANPGMRIALEPAARITGTVRDNAGAPIEGVQLGIEGHPLCVTRSGSDGAFSLRGAPAGVSVTLRAGKAGYTSYRQSHQLTAHQVLAGVQITLQHSAVATLYGFPVEIDTIRTVGLRRFADGAFVELPSNPGMKLTDPAATLAFSDLELDPDNAPLASRHVLDVLDLRVEVGGIPVVIQGAVEVRAVTGMSTGVITGSSISLGQVVQNSVSGSTWNAERATWDQTTPAGLYHDGKDHRNGAPLAIAPESTPSSVHLFGFNITPDYTRSSLGADGLHYSGSITIPGVAGTVTFTDISFIGSSSHDGRVTFRSATVNNVPSIRLDATLFALSFTSASWDYLGLHGRGNMSIPALGNGEYTFSDVSITPTGEVARIDLGTGGSGSALIAGRPFTVEGLSIGSEQDGAPYLRLVGSLALPQFDRPVAFSVLKVHKDGTFDGALRDGQSPQFSGVVPVHLKAVDFVKHGAKTDLDLDGAIGFEIPNLPRQNVAFTFHDDGTFSMEKISIGCDLGVAGIKFEIAWVQSEFQGKGMLAIPDVFVVEAAFRYKSSTAWSIQVDYDPAVPIPICTFLTLEKIGGGLTRNENTWTVELRGDLGVVNGNMLIIHVARLAVTGSPSNVILDGNGTVVMFPVVAGGVTMGGAAFGIDARNLELTAALSYIWYSCGLTMESQASFHIKGKEFWGLKASMTVRSWFGLADAGGTAAIGWSYPDWMHDSPLPMHPDNQVINGVHAHAYQFLGNPDEGKSGVGASWDVEVFAMIEIHNNAFQLSGAARTKAQVWARIEWKGVGVGISGTATLSAAVGWQAPDKLSFSADARIELCGECCGKEVCFPAGFGVSYGPGGWDYSVDVF